MSDEKRIPAENKHYYVPPSGWVLLADGTGMPMYLYKRKIEAGWKPPRK